MKKILVIIMFFLANMVFSQLQLTGKAKYNLNYEIRLGNSSGRCATFGLMWFYFENNTKKEFIKADNGGDGGIDNTTLSGTLLFEDSNLINNFSLHSGRRSKSWGSCSDDESRIATRSVKKVENVTYTTDVLTFDGHVKIKTFPVIDLENSVPANNAIAENEYLIVPNITGVENQYYNWQYAIALTPEEALGQYVPSECTYYYDFEEEYCTEPYYIPGELKWIDLPTTTTGKNSLNIQAKSFLPSSLVGSNFHLRVIPKVDHATKEGSPITLTYKKSAPDISNISVQKTTCSDSKDGSATFTFERDLISGEFFNFTLKKKDPNGDIQVGENKYVVRSEFKNKQFTWDSLEPGTYYLSYETILNEGTEKAKAPNSKDFTITAPAAVSFTPSPQNVKCKGSSTGSISVTAQGGRGSYEYSKNGGTTWQNSATFSGLVAGSYSVLVKDSKGCIALQGAKKIEITEPYEALAIAIIEKNDPIEHDGNQGNIEVSASGGTGNLSFTWKNSFGSGIGSGAIISNLVGGSYTVTVTDANACQASREISLINPPVFTVSIAQLKGVSCHGRSDAQLKAVVSGGAEPLFYEWQGAFSNGENLTTIPAGVYKVTVTDINNVVRTASFTVPEPNVLQAGLNSVTAVSCNGGNNGSIDINVLGGTSPYNYKWTKNDQTFASTQDISSLSAGNYDVNITDDKGCPTELTDIEITQPEEALSLELNPLSPLSFGATNGKIELTPAGGTPPYTYLWNTGSTTQNLQNIGAGNYSVTVTDSKLCTASENWTLTEPEKLELSMSQTAYILCKGESTASLQSTVTGGVKPYSYQWKKNGQWLSDITSSLADLTASDYELTVTDKNDNKVSVVYTVSEPTALSASNQVTDVLCFDNPTGAIDLSVSGGTPPYTYLWNNGSTTQDVLNLKAGVYSVLCTDANGCIKKVENSQIRQPSAPLTLSQKVTQPSGFGLGNGSISVTAQGGTTPYTYEWNTGQTSPEIASIKAGDYTVTTTDANACKTSLLVTLTQPELLKTTISVSHPLLCFADANGSLKATTQGGVAPYTYSWKKGNTSLATTSDIQNLTTATYTVTVTDTNNNQVSQNFVLGQPDLLTVGFDMTPISCSGDKIGSLTALPQGGVGPYSYSWSNGVSNQKLTNVGAGSYLVNVTDANACATLAKGTVTSTSNIKVTSNLQDPGCYQACNGSITLEIIGGSGDYTMKWDAVAKGNGLQATNLCAGNYSVEIKDNVNGCVLPMDFTLNQPPQLTVNLGDDKLLCSGQSVLIQPIINTKEVAYNWTSADGFSGTTAQVKLDKTGEYQLEITDTKGCKAMDTIRITTSNQLLDATFLVSSQIYKDQEIVLINVSNQAGQTYEWLLPAEATAVSEISKSKIIKFSKIGVYSVGLKSKNEAGCTTTSTKQLLVEEDPKLPDPNPQTSSFIKEFLVYPNPTINNGLFTVKVSLSESAPISLTLYEQSNGSLLNQTDLPASKEHLKEYRIPLSSGIYLIILRTSKGVQSKKIIVN